MMIQLSIFDFFQGIIDFITGFVDMIISVINHIRNFFVTLGQVTSMIFDFVGSLPTIVQVFLACMSALLILGIVLSLTRDYL